jgi:hypothetical protein
VTQPKCFTDVQTGHRLESHKSQLNRRALFHSFFRDFQDLCCLGFFSIFDILETYRRTIDQQFDQLGPPRPFGGMQDQAFDLDGLIELA